MKPFSAYQKQLIRQLSQGIVCRAVLTAPGMKNAYLYHEANRRVQGGRAINGDTLYRLREQGIIAQRDVFEPGITSGCRYYELTEKGRAAAQELQS